MTTEIQEIRQIIIDLINPPFDHVTRSQAAQYLKCSINNIDRYCRDGIRDRNGRVYKLHKNNNGSISYPKLIEFKVIRDEKRK